MEIDLLPKNYMSCNGCFEDSNIVIFGAGLDVTTSFRPGTRFAPQVMRMESIGLETYSPYFDKDLCDYNIHDAGDLSLLYGNVDDSLRMIAEMSQSILDAGKKSVMIGGEHLASFPVIEQYAKKYDDLCIIHFDAHTDLRSSFFEQEFSHATVIRKVWDIIGDGRIFQFGIRSGTKEEFDWAKDGHVFLNKFDFKGIEETVKSIGNRPVYFTCDLDVLDPSIVPGTGTPEAGGVTFKELMDAIMVISKCNIVGADIVELSPHYDASGASTAVACKVLRETLLMMV